MRRKDDDYWQRLRRDKRSGFATVLTVVAWGTVVVSIGMLVAPGTQSEARGNPLYWLVMLPVAWWATKLTSYEPGPVRFLSLAQLTAPPVAVLAAIAAGRMGENAAPFWIAAGVPAAAALGGWLLFRGSMLNRQGPAR